jgi:nitroimidazol reductase NimA-like FMN-containing flavoprotein (pyridoxamine 5'-phosphate oxidase superfamily)
LNVDEPLFSDDPSEPQDRAGPEVRERIRRLVSEQPYAVLCVQGGGQPYGALVAFAFSEDLRTAVFTTPITTRKYRLLSACSRVAIVIDDRPGKAGALMETEAVTATGDATPVPSGSEFERWAELLISRHRYLESFVRSPSCALFRVAVIRYFHVARFQEVSQWIPTATPS